MADKEASLLIRIKEAGGEALGRIGASLKAIGAIAATAFGVVSAVVIKSVTAYAEAEKATNQLNQALIQQGIYTKALSEEYHKNADALAAKSLFEDEAIVKAQAIIQGYVGQTKVSKELVQATLDLAQRTGDLDGAASAVGKTIGTSTNALARSGIKLDENATKAQKLDAVVRQLNNGFGGQAEAATRGLGSIQMMNKSIGELFEQIGKHLQPVVVLVTQAIRGMAESLKENQGAIDFLRGSLEITAKGGVYLYGSLKAVSTLIRDTLVGDWKALGLAMKGEFSAAWEAVKATDATATKNLSDNWFQMKENIAAIDQAFAEKKQQNLQSEEEMLNQSMARREQIAADKATIDAEKAVEKLEMDTIRDEEELNRLIAFEQAKSDIEFKTELARLENVKKNAKTKKEMLEAELAQKKLIDNQMLTWERMTAQQRMETLSAVGAHASELANNLVILSKGKNKELIVLQKALGIAMVIINGEIAKMRALAELGPIFGGIAVGVITANQIAASAVIASQGLASGGIVTARPGGMLATIGEGGRDEAVIPLDSEEAGDRLGGMGGVTVHFNGPIMADKAQAREFAKMLDRELFDLHRNGESYSSEGRVS